MRLLRTLGMLAIMMVAFGISGFAATVIVPAANTNTTSNRKPFGSFFGFERTAAIYTVAEHGMAPGSTVTDVCFFVNSVTTPDDVPITIYMSTTASTTFVASTFASEIAGASPVFTGTITGASLIANSFRCVAITPFAYTGNNLKVMVQADFGGAGNESSTAKQFRWSAGASQTWQADGAAPAGNGTVSTTSRPNTQLIFTPPAGPGTLQFSSATYAGNEGTSALITVNRVGGQSGAVSVNYATSDGTATGADYTTASGTLMWADMDSAAKTFTVPLTTDVVADPGETVTLTLSTPVGTTITGTNPAVLTITDVPPPFSGTYTVGSGGNYPSLTNAGGIFEAINLSGATGNITINITSDLTGELGTNALNEIAGGFTVLIKPSGAPRMITGSNSGALIRLNGADGVRIDGSTAAMFADNIVGGNPALRELTIQNTNVGTAAVVISVGSNGANGALNNTIKNVRVLGQDPLTTLLGISIGGATPGTAATAPNNGNRVENCFIGRALFGIFSSGVVATPTTGTVITMNETSAVATDRIRRVGIVVFNEDGIQITENSLNGISTTESADAIGIGVGTQGIDTTTVTSGGVSNALVSRNKINGVNSASAVGFSASGITVAGGTLGANTIANNMITGVTAPATSPDIVAGVFVVGAVGSNTKLYYNSVSMTGDRDPLVAGQMPSYGIAITGTDPTVELKNNIFYTTQTASGGGANAVSYAIGMVTTTFANLDSNYNDFFSTGANDGGFRSGSLAAAAGTNYATVALWGAAVADDANSIILGEVDPSFVNPLNDLHLTGVASPVYDKGIPVSVLNDFDGQIRSVVGLTGGVPDIGADEAAPIVAANASVSGRVSTANGNGIRNAIIEVSGGNLTQPLYIRTGSFGYYQVDDLEVGETYVLTVRSKRFVFANPSVVITVQENVGEVDFEANP